MTPDNTQTATVENWTPQELKAAFDAGEVAIIDVRTPQEFSFEHIHGALLAPLATFEPRHLPAQDGKRLVFHCGSGVRSRKVADACLAAGIARCNSALVASREPICGASGTGAHRPGKSSLARVAGPRRGLLQALHQWETLPMAAFPPPAGRPSDTKETCMVAQMVFHEGGDEVVGVIVAGLVAQG